MSTTSLTTKHNKHYIRYTVTSGCISFCFQNKKYFLVSKPFGEEIAKRKILIMNKRKKIDKMVLVKILVNHISI